MPTFTPVDNDPFAAPAPAGSGGNKLVPVDNDPFAGAAPPAGPSIPTMTVKPAPNQPMMSGWERFGTGLKDPVVGTYQLGAHLVSSDAAKDADAYVRQREADIRATTPNPDRVVTKLDQQGRASHYNTGKTNGVDAIRMMGDIANPVPIAGAAVGGPVVGGLLSGALAGAMQPVAGDKYWRNKTEQIVGDAAIGGASGLGGKVFGGLIGPRLDAATKRMVDAGVDLTPGQAMGGAMKPLEEYSKAVPIAGTFIRGAELRTVDSFNRATVNEALKPIGVKVPDNLSGRDLIAKGQEELDKAYNDLLPKMKFKADAQFVNDITRLDNLVASLALPPAQKAQWEKIFSERFVDRLSPNDEMNGETLKQVESELKRFATNYRSSTDAAQRDAGFVADELREEIRDALERQDPTNAGKLRDINTAYAMFARVNAASVEAPAQGGRFTPGQLLMASKAQDKSVSRRAFARGDALLQSWADDAQTVIGNKIPDSGTAGRLGTAELLSGALAGYVDPRTVGVIGGMSLPYTRPATRLLNQNLQYQAPWRDVIGSAVRSTAPAGGMGSPAFNTDLRQKLGIPDKDDDHGR